MLSSSARSMRVSGFLGLDDFCRERNKTREIRRWCCCAVCRGGLNTELRNGDIIQGWIVSIFRWTHDIKKGCAWRGVHWRRIEIVQSSRQQKESETWKQNENVRVHFLVIVNVKYSTQQQHGSTVHGWMGTKTCVFSASIDDIQFPISIRLTRVEAIKAGTEKGFFTAIIQLWTVLLRLRARWRGFSFQVSALHYIYSLFSRIGQLIPFLVIDLYTHMVD